MPRSAAGCDAAPVLFEQAGVLPTGLEPWSSRPRPPGPGEFPRPDPAAIIPWLPERPLGDALPSGVGLDFRERDR